jgi:hypothetical protein
MNLEQNKITKTCIGCATVFTYEPWISSGKELCERTHCEECMEKEHLEHEAKMEAKAHAESVGRAIKYWENLCPNRFLESDENHPEFKRSLLTKAMQWKPTSEKPWLGIVGKKGSCKTRIALMRMREGMMDLTEIPPSVYGTRSDNLSNFETPNAPMFITAYEFAEAIQSKFGDKNAEAKAILRQAMNSWLLVFDDLGKARNTPAVITGLFAMIDHRHAHNLPTIWTANSTPEEFCEGMPPDVAGPLVRRLKESSTLYSIA